MPKTHMAGHVSGDANPRRMDTSKPGDFEASVYSAIETAKLKNLEAQIICQVTYETWARAGVEF